MIDLTHLQANLTRTTAGGTEDLVTLTVNSRPATGFNLFYGSTAPYTPEEDLFFNNFAVTGAARPEPGSVALIAVSGIIVAALKSRRKT